jgi:putative Holliday junction resolvase
MNRGRRIAFDYGDVRIGVAICDPDGILASPLPHIDARHPKLAGQVSELLDEYEPIAIYVGRPKNMSGSEGIAVEKVEGFVEKLKAITDLPITFIDERLSTVDAARRLREAGKSAKDSKALIDSMAAVAILESGLANEAR